MSTIQERLNGHSSPSFFKSVIDDLTKIVIPSKQRERGISPERSPQRKIATSTHDQSKPNPDAPAFAANVHQQDELRGVKEVGQQCQFTFADGRQCRMQRSQLCAHHASKQEPSCGEKATNRMRFSPLEEVAPELEALCGDLTTATNINRALAQTFLLLAQGRISQKQAVAFGYLSQLLLQSLPAIRREFIDAFGSSVYDARLRSRLDPRPVEKQISPKVAQPAKEPVPARSNDISRLSTPPPVPSREAVKIGRAPDGPFAGAAAVKNTSEASVIRTAPALAVSASSPPRPPVVTSAPPTNLPQPPAAAAIASPPPKALAVSSERARSQRPGFPEACATPPVPNKQQPAGPSPAAAVPPGITLNRAGHTDDWYAPASWSKLSRPDPFPRRMDKLQRELRGMSSCRLRRLQHLQQSKFLE